ncbi:MAG: hypothetical protein EBU93_05180, partial [Chlamydiae bacterium]|nr:hypothetical protein [Chlamydiota bacterium]
KNEPKKRDSRFEKYKKWIRYHSLSRLQFVKKPQKKLPLYFSIRKKNKSFFFLIHLFFATCNT